MVSDTFIQYLRPFGSIPCEWMGFIQVVSDTFIQYLPKDLLGHYHTNEGGSFRWYRTLSSNTFRRTFWVNTMRKKGVQLDGNSCFYQKKILKSRNTTQNKRLITRGINSLFLNPIDHFNIHVGVGIDLLESTVDILRDTLLAATLYGLFHRLF